MRQSKQMTSKDVAIYAGIGLGLYFLLKKGYLNTVKSTFEQTALQTGSASAFAKQFKLAFDNDNALGAGTNEALFFNTLYAIPDKETYEAVMKAYKGLYNRNLNSDIESELDSTEYQKALSILNKKAGKASAGVVKQSQTSTNAFTDSEKRYAERLYNAFFKGGFFGMNVDEVAIFKVINEIPTKKVFYNVRDKAYPFLFDNRVLVWDLKANLSSSEYKKFNDILAKKK